VSAYRPLHNETPEQQRIRQLEEQNADTTRRLNAIWFMTLDLRRDHERQLGQFEIAKTLLGCVFGAVSICLVWLFVVPLLAAWWNQ